MTIKHLYPPALKVHIKPGLHIELEAHNPTYNMHRYYSIDVALDHLFGDWLITTHYGRELANQANANCMAIAAKMMRNANSSNC